MADEQTPPRHVALYQQARKLALGDHPLAKYVPPVLLMLDALLCSLIISNVAYTEIDWKAYMEQIGQYVKGERDYAKMEGGTGPLVYPAAHVYIYLGLYHITNEGRNILMAQRVFGVLYLATLSMVMAPLYIFPMLILSKRLHSIFMLRLFNDCWAVFFFWIAVYAYQRRQWTLGTLVYSWALGIKMSLLLPLPAIGAVLFLGQGYKSALSQAFWIIRIHVLIALPFLHTNLQGYASRAFDFSREFLFKWTVNWRFIGEEKFLSKGFSILLLVGHVSALALFVGKRWLRPAETPFVTMVQKCLEFQEPLGKMQHAVSTRISPNYMLTTILSATAIGVLFARSLHYQFFAYIAWSTPFLLWRSGMHPALQYALWAAQEWGWNVYPSTDVSSMVVVGILFVTVLGVFWGTRKDFVNPQGEGASAGLAGKKIN